MFKKLNPKAKAILAYYVDEAKKIIDSSNVPNYNNTYTALENLENVIKEKYNEYKTSGEDDGNNYMQDLKLALKKAQNLVYIYSNLKNKINEILKQDPNLTEEQKGNLNRVLQEIKIGWDLTPEIDKSKDVEKELNEIIENF